MNTEQNGSDLIAIAKVTGLAALNEEEPDRLGAWLEAYFALEVTTSILSQREQRRDLERFLAFMRLETGSDHRAAWTPRLSRAFVEVLRSEVQEVGGRRFSDRTINRTLAHLKTFATWIHKNRPFPFGNPTEKLKNLIVPVGLEIERSLTRSRKRFPKQFAGAGGRRRGRSGGVAGSVLSVGGHHRGRLPGGCSGETSDAFWRSCTPRSGTPSVPPGRRGSPAPSSRGSKPKTANIQ